MDSMEVTQLPGFLDLVFHVIFSRFVVNNDLSLQWSAACNSAMRIRLLPSLLIFKDQECKEGRSFYSAVIPC